MKYIGADGCKRGWFVVVLENDLTWHFQIFETIDKLWKDHHDADRILIDVPIGLPSSMGRDCDMAARRLLGAPRASSVFSAPSRPAAYAEDYESACKENRMNLGVGISIQTWGICRKIREVDEFLLGNAEARVIIRESHPEICFWAFAGGRAMAESKKKKGGQHRRLDILDNMDSRAKQIYDRALKQYKRRNVGRDDIIDSLILAVTASEPQDQLSKIPSRPPMDEKGLSMEIVFSKRNLESESRESVDIGEFDGKEELP